VAPLAERWNGRRWRIERAPDTGGGLTGVACDATGACKAVGSSIDNRAVAERRRVSGRWSLQGTRTPTTAPEGSLTAVSCRSARACTAVGLFLGSPVRLAESWDGRRWRFDSVSASPRQGLPKLQAVSCAASTCVAVGSFATNAGDEPLVARRSAGKWSLTRLRNSGDLEGVSCPSPVRCVAVGQVDGNAVAESWDGSRWTRQPVPSPAGAAQSRLTAVSCTAATACTAVGSASFDDATGIASIAFTLAEAWDGTRWTIQPTPTRGSASLLTAISCAGAGACVATGVSCAFASCTDPDRPNEPFLPSDRTLALAWDGTSWTLPATPDPAGTANLLNGVSCASPRACTAVGTAATVDAGTIVASDGFAEDWDGTTWRLEGSTAAPAPFGELDDVSCAGGGCTAVGAFEHGDYEIPLIGRTGGPLAG
jgi:hypothetical protein